MGRRGGEKVRTRASEREREREREVIAGARERRDSWTKTRDSF